MKRLNPPRKVTFWITVGLAVVAILAVILPIPVLSGLAFWLLFAAYLLLAIAVVAKGI